RHAAQVAADARDIFAVHLRKPAAVGAGLRRRQAGWRNRGLQARSSLASALSGRRCATRAHRNQQRDEYNAPYLCHAALPRRKKLLQSARTRYGRRRMSDELSGLVAIVTGGASGIGLASAALLQGSGATVVVADLQSTKDGPGRFVEHDVAS